jgi:hypothetical protein
MSTMSQNKTLQMLSYTDLMVIRWSIYAEDTIVSYYTITKISTSIKTNNNGDVQILYQQ